MHTASEPVCVVTRIVRTAEELEPEKEEEQEDEPVNPVNTVGSSSGNCNGGFTMLSLGLLSALIIKRKSH